MDKDDYVRCSLNMIIENLYEGGVVKNSQSFWRCLSEFLSHKLVMSHTSAVEAAVVQLSG